ncbi:hypothetical protein [Tabrizicola sp. BL-A-41-H6]|uniref:hypothetical protein n=1 Tax=Tabrizicola sp. BL-A-41-H6 TaxID=3421107 RepID=UPI003D673340
MAQDAQAGSHRSSMPINAGWPAFGDFVTGGFGTHAARPDKAGRGWFGTWGRRVEPSHRDIERLSASERRELGIAAAGGGPATPARALSGLTLLALAGR